MGLESTLTDSGIKVSPELVEETLRRFENAGMLGYRFFEWCNKQRGYKHSVRAYHTMISSLAKIRQYQLMWDLVNKMRAKEMLNVETFGIIIRKYARAHRVDEAIYTFNVMDKYGVTPNLAAFNILLAPFCKSKNARKAQAIFDDMKERFTPDSKTFSILIEGWGREPNLPKAKEVFDDMICKPDVVTYGIMVDILCKVGKVGEALDIIRDMMATGSCRPNTYIYSVLIHTYGIQKQTKEAVDVFLEMESNGITADVVAYNALTFCKGNQLGNCSMVYQRWRTDASYLIQGV